MSTRLNGIIGIHRSTTGSVGSWTKICDEVRISSTNLNVQEILNELATTKSQSGGEWEPEFHIEDFSNYDACENLAVGAGRAKVFIAVVFSGGTIYKTRESIFMRVTPNMSANRREGDAHWTLKFDLAATRPVEIIASLV